MNSLNRIQRAGIVQHFLRKTPWHPRKSSVELGPHRSKAKRCRTGKPQHKNLDPPRHMQGQAVHDRRAVCPPPPALRKCTTQRSNQTDAFVCFPKGCCSKFMSQEHCTFSMGSTSQRHTLVGREHPTHSSRAGLTTATGASPSLDPPVSRPDRTMRRHNRAARIFGML